MANPVSTYKKFDKLVRTVSGPASMRLLETLFPDEVEAERAALAETVKSWRGRTISIYDEGTTLPIPDYFRWINKHFALPNYHIASYSRYNHHTLEDDEITVDGKWSFSEVEYS